MDYYVYMIVTENEKKISYVGYTNNLDKRLKLHIAQKVQNLLKEKMDFNYYKKFNQSSAMKYEYSQK